MTLQCLQKRYLLAVDATEMAFVRNDCVLNREHIAKNVNRRNWEDVRIARQIREPHLLHLSRSISRQINQYTPQVLVPQQFNHLVL